MADVDVIIPTRDRAALVVQAIESVLSQTMVARRVIVVDDGSEDDTPMVLRKYGDKIQVLEADGLGVSAARNRGLAASKAPWVALLDSDDLWEPTKLERQWADLQAQSYPYRWSHTEEIWIRNGRRVNPMKKHQKPSGWVFEASLKLCCVSPSSALLERSFLESMGGFDESLPACEDYALWLKMAAIEPIHFLDEALTIKHGGHDDQLSRKYWGMDRFRAQALENLLRNQDLEPTQRRQALENLIFRYDVLLTGAQKRGGSPYEHQWVTSRSAAETALGALE